EEGGRRVAAALRGLQVIVRDRRSLDTLRALGIEGALGGDPALLLSPTPDLNCDPERVIVAPRGDITDATKGLQMVTAQLREEGRRVTALAFMPEQDEAAARSLGADEVLSTRDPQAALDAIAAAGFVVGVRLHAVILAAAAGVPFAGVSYDPKVQGFCADAGAPAFPTAFDPAALCQQVLSHAAPNWEAIGEMKKRAERSFTRALAG
ncbi:MAG: polysaccharide pyruvyl transferase family protein, partial [Deinococcota bacterium]